MNRFIQIQMTDTGTEPVTLQQLKDHFNISSLDYDTILTNIITVARKRIEKYTHCSLIDKDIVVTAFLERVTKLPYGVDSITLVRLLEGQLAGVNDWEVLGIDEYVLIADEFTPSYKGTYEISYSTVAKTDEDLIYDVKRVAHWMFLNTGADIDSMPIELMSNAKRYKLLSWG